MSFWDSVKRIGKRAWGGIKKIGKAVAPIIRGIKKGKDFVQKHLGVISKIPVIGKYAKQALDIAGRPIDIANGAVNAGERLGRRDYLGAANELYKSVQ